MQTWPDGWREVDENARVRLRGEFKRALPPTFPLDPETLEAIAENSEVDEFLFRVSDGRVAEMHLPIRGPGGVTCVLYSSIEDWRVRRNDLKR
ncbi:hypothetical protein DSM104635_02116 [Terricaulis silvestris]|uniref:Uncharacterized protein n=1 Tax=Terricaulis silvestris TaxID=2686094 RepID=A0A6I6MPG7_9CAUL|nr:hypothetical protein DSM104635_02116 [Terricaulis silvestris]